MNDILADLSTPALARAVKANLLAFFRYLGRSPAIHFHQEERLIRWHSRLAHPWFNGVLTLQPAAAGETAAIQETIAFFQSRQVSLFTWWLDPDLPAAAWDAHLRAHGFGYDTHTPGMAVDLAALRPDISLPAGFQISPVEEPAALAVWSRAFLTGYELPPAWADDLFQFMAGLGLELPLRHYLGYLDGRPVATSSLFLAAGVAGVLFVATDPQARGQGIGAAMTIAPLQDAQALGYQVGILQSSDMGFKLYQRLGFQHVGQVDNYYFRLT